MPTQLRMLVQNTIQDYPTWRKVFDENLHTLPPFGLTLEWVRQDADDQNQVWFSLLVEDRAKADAYLSDPANAEVGQRAGAISGQIFYIQDPK
ncbi:MAG: hypothetical protein ACSHX5_01710 [Phycisphaerales bacterium]